MLSWTEKEKSFLKQHYPNRGKLWCMQQLSRPEGSIRSQAASLNLQLDKTGAFFKDFQRRAAHSKIGKKRPNQALVMKRLHNEGKLIQTPASRAATGRAVKERFKKHGHPRGMLGTHHTPKACAQMSKTRFGKKLNLSPAQRQALSDRQSAHMQHRLATKGSVYSRSTAGWFRINNQHYFFRSTWEVSYARYLEWLLNTGQITKWEYEPDTFWFEHIKRGVRSYLPDFKVTDPTGVSYHEVKGWLDPKSKTKLSRMKRYYPHIKMILIQKPEYQSILQWERLFPPATPVPNYNSELTIH